MSELGETPGNKTVRLGIERRITDYHKAGDMTHVDMGLDSYPHGKVRKPLGAAAMYIELVRTNSPAARFFRQEAVEEAVQDTEEFEAVAWTNY